MKPSWLFWVIGIFALIWTLFGAFDLTMTVTQNADYLSGYDPDLLAYWFDLPAWRYVLWVGGILSTLAGSVLFLMRRGQAVPLLWVAPVFMVIGVIADGLNGVYTDYGVQGLLASIFIISFYVLFAGYASWQRRRGVLRA